MTVKNPHPKKRRQQIDMFYKDMSTEDLIELLDTDFPISLKYNQDLVERISIRYPILPKKDVAIIVKGVFNSFRDLLVMGKRLTFEKLFSDAHLFMTKKTLYLRTTTPKELKHD